ncbi:hypothetical protein B0H15DRAFT_957789 [Mycena belliarum]|uniref:Uncharacterized protein n=1 Tax=Mycena belliarum TaxID=1033014 RepID=A0AAD6XGB8_9AGAR|nr:hypothetical protein B0H15DRAFT_957789 [Mycena belliae]
MVAHNAPAPSPRSPAASSQQLASLICLHPSETPWTEERRRKLPQIRHLQILDATACSRQIDSFQGTLTPCSSNEVSGAFIANASNPPCLAAPVGSIRDTGSSAVIGPLMARQPCIARTLATGRGSRKSIATLCTLAARERVTLGDEAGGGAGGTTMDCCALPVYSGAVAARVPRVAGIRSLRTGNTATRAVIVCSVLPPDAPRCAWCWTCSAADAAQLSALGVLRRQERARGTPARTL